MVTVALIGADGAGKTTVARSIEQASSLPVKYVYMGSNLEASNHVLPTTRLIRALRRALGHESQGGPPDPGEKAKRRSGGLKGMARSVKSNVVLFNRMCEEWYRLVVARLFERRGFVVLFDRHFYADYWAHGVSDPKAKLPAGQRVHRWVLRRLYPRPDLLVILDASAEVLFARKPEGSPQLLERRRQEYLDLEQKHNNVAIVDASQQPSAVVADVLGLIRAATDDSR